MTNIAHLTHDSHDAPAGTRTIREWADMTGRKHDSVMKTVRRKIGTGYTLDTPMSADQFDGLFPNTPATRTQKTDSHSDETTQRTRTSNTGTGRQHTRSAPNLRKLILYTLMGMPAIASIQNIYTVTVDIAAHPLTAVLLTGLFSATPFLFVLAGMANRWTKALAAAMITYECFANITRIYGGLTGFGHGDYPTRFLGLVCDFFDTGTYATAKTLSVIMGTMAAAVFYTAFHELNTRK